MKPILGIVDKIEYRNGVSTREKVVSLFGLAISKRIECYPIEKDTPVDFTSGGTNLTYVEDD